MLVQFSVSNYKTFREKAVLSFIASNYDKETREKENVVTDVKFKLRLLKSAVIFGANASGKSKLLDALLFMKRFVLDSSKYSQKGDPIQVDPFRLNSESEKLPSEFEVIFIHNEVMYRYGFEVNKEQVTSEWLYYKTNLKEVELFYRDHQTFEPHSRNFSKGLTVIKQDLVRDNALLLSVAAQFNDTISIAVMDWFQKLKTISGLREEGYKGFTVGRTENPDYKNKILELLKSADLGIQDLKIVPLDPNSLPVDMPRELKEKIIRDISEDNAKYFSDIITFHNKFNNKGQLTGRTDFSLDEDESSGTRKFFALTGPILDVLENGYTLIVDELDSKLHPNLVCKIVSLFNSESLNLKNAQLLFNTHDTNLLSSGLFRKDQIWFTEKNKKGEVRLYSLGDFKSDEVRKNEAFEDNYIKGKYGAIPFLSFFEN